MSLINTALRLLLYAALHPLCFASAEQLIGEWKSTEGRDLATVQIRLVDGRFLLRASGHCTPANCDMGEVSAQGYGPDVSARLPDSVTAISAQFVFDFVRTLVIVRPAASDRVQVEKYSVFTDNSGRSPYHATTIMSRDTGTACQDLPLPVQISPKDQAVFSVYPRVTTIEWQPVSGALQYGVEIDCFHCCKSGAWCTDIGRTFLVEQVELPNHTFRYVGAQPGRWRVWSIGEKGPACQKSGWREFRYLK